MKLSLKGALGLAAVHLALVIALALGLERTLRSLEEELSADTVRLLAREQANLVFERSVETLLRPDADSRRRLHERIEDLTLLSEVVTSLAVVDAAGNVVASEAPQPRGRFAPAAQLFDEPPRSRLETSGRSFLQGGEAVEADTRLLRQLEGLGRVYRTLAHELRAPLGAMMINVDLLHESLGSGEGAPSPARRHVDVLREELQRGV